MLEIFQYDFMVRAFAAGIIIGIVAPLIGMFLVVKRYALLGDTLAHVSLVGVATGILFNLNPIITALLSTVIAALGMEELRKSKKIFGESVLAIFLSGSLAIAIMLIASARKLNVNFFSFLFGNITTVTHFDIFTIIPLSILIIFTIIFAYKRFFLISLDEELAQASGIQVKRFNILLMLLASLAISLAMRIVGALLIGALMVIPVATALQLRKGFIKSMLLSLIFSEIAVIGGLFSSFYLDLPSGATIVILALIFFLVSLFLGG